MLTPEERQRIEAEEQKRITEEAYRTEVRSRLSGPTLTVVQKKWPSWRTVAGAILALAIVILVVTALPSNRTASGSFASPLLPSRARYIPVTQKVTDGQTVVKARGFVSYPLQITPDMRDAHVTGKFTAGGGSGNDIEVVLANEEEFTNWVNGHPARAYYSTNGKKTTDHFDVRLAPGSYVLAFSNKFSAITDKFVLADVDLNYSHEEVQ
jgi:hypothetical protein